MILPNRAVVKLLGQVLRSLLRIESKLDALVSFKVQEDLGKIVILPQMTDPNQLDPMTKKKVDYQELNVRHDGGHETITIRGDSTVVPTTTLPERL